MLRSIVATTLSALALVSAPSVAHADDTPPAPAVNIVDTTVTTTENRWYGWQTLAVDLGIHVGSFTAVNANGGYDRPQTEIAIASFGAYAIGAPIVHALHGHWGKAGLSLAMRTTGWAAAGLVGFGVGAATGETDGPATGALIGVMAGFVAPMVIDSAVLANEKVAKKPRDMTFAPTAAVTPTGAFAGLGGTF